MEEANAGADPLGFMPALNLVEVRAAAREDDSSSSDEEEGGEGKPETEVKAAAASAPAAASGEGKKQRKAKAEAAAPPPAEEWEPGKKPWWAGMFVRAGRMGSIKQELKGGHSGKPKINVSGFREQDQENLYEQVRRWCTWDLWWCPVMRYLVMLQLYGCWVSWRGVGPGALRGVLVCEAFTT